MNGGKGSVAVKTGDTAILSAAKPAGGRQGAEQRLKHGQTHQFAVLSAVVFLVILAASFRP